MNGWTSEKAMEMARRASDPLMAKEYRALARRLMRQGL